MKNCTIFQNSQASPPKYKAARKAVFFFKKKGTAGLNKAEGGP